MPGLPKHPSALDMDVDEDGKIIPSYLMWKADEKFRPFLNCIKKLRQLNVVPSNLTFLVFECLNQGFYLLHHSVY